MIDFLNTPLIFWPVLAAIFAFVTAGLVANFRRITAYEKRIRDLAPLSDEWSARRGS